MRKLWLSSLGTMLALLVAAPAAHAANPAGAGEGLFSRLEVAPQFAKLLNQDKSYQVLAESPTTASLEIVKANAALIDATAAEIRFNLGPGVDLKVHRVEAYTTAAGSLVWSGVVADPGKATVPVAFDPLNLVTLVRNGDMLTGNVHYNGDWYKIRPLRSGGHAIVLVDGKAMPPDHPPAYADLPIVRMPVRPANEKANTVIRVLVNWTPAVAAATADVPGLITLAVAESNQGYTNSGVSITLQLAASAKTTYTESGDFTTDLSRYRSTTDSYMTEIHTTRNSSAADVAVLLINNTQYCGLASGIGSTASTAFVAVYWDCATGYYSFAHEIGHLQSARHDPANDPTTTPYAWGHGYQYTGSPKWRTIMAYDCTSGCTRLDYWSNPSNLYNGHAMGTTTKNNNARVLNDTRATVAAFR
jgi:hypothetical protein